MIKLSTFRAALIFLSGTLALGVVACSVGKQMSNSNHNALPVGRQSHTSAAPQPSMPVATTKSVMSKTPESGSMRPNQFDLALDKAYGAISISQSAQSADDWELVANQWQEAIALLQTVPKDSPEQASAQNKIAQYQRLLSIAQQQATRPLKQNPTDPNSGVASIPEIQSSPVSKSQIVAVEVPLAIPKTQSVFQAVIKRRVGRTPVIDVTFNGARKFEMILDTGASGTVLTQQTATALGVVPVATAKANTASAKDVEFPVGYVRSIEVNGAVVKDIPVAIAPAAVLETGLLGHDFFDNYDVTIKRDVVEFRSR